MVYKTVDEEGNIGYRKELELCLTENYLTEAPYSDYATAGLSLDMYFQRAMSAFPQYEYSFEQQTLNGKFYFFYDFSSFEILDGDSDPYLETELTGENIFRQTYTCTMVNFFADLPEVINSEFGGLNNFFSADKINNLPLDYYLYGETAHATNGEGKRTFTSSDGVNSITLLYWRTTLSKQPELVYYRQWPVTTGWNIVAIAAGVVVVAVLCLIFFIKAKKNKERNNEEEENTTDAQENK